MSTRSSQATSSRRWARLLRRRTPAPRISGRCSSPGYLQTQQRSANFLSNFNASQIQALAFVGFSNTPVAASAVSADIGKYASQPAAGSVADALMTAATSTDHGTMILNDAVATLAGGAAGGSPELSRQNNVLTWAFAWGMSLGVVAKYVIATDATSTDQKNKALGVLEGVAATMLGLAAPEASLYIGLASAAGTPFLPQFASHPLSLEAYERGIAVAAVAKTLVDQHLIVDEDDTSTSDCKALSAEKLVARCPASEYLSSKRHESRCLRSSQSSGGEL